MTEICEVVLIEAAEGSWAPFFKAEWISPTRDIIVHVSVPQGNTGQRRGLLGG